MMRVLLAFLVAVVLSVSVASRAGSAERPAGSTAGQLLVAAPGLADPRFAETVVFMVEHDADGAFGLIVNRTYGTGPLASLLAGFGIDADGLEGRVALRFGGPVEPGLLFVLHTGEFDGEKTHRAPNGFAVSADRDVLEAIAKGEGPRRSLVIAGYAGWGPGQLESEMARGDWTVAPADENLVFDEDDEKKWQRASDAAGLPL